MIDSVTIGFEMIGLVDARIAKARSAIAESEATRDHLIRLEAWFQGIDQAAYLQKYEAWKKEQQ